MHLQQWEYCFVSRYSGNVTYCTPGGTKLDPALDDQKSFHVRMTDLGLKGWEAFGFEESDIWFKRPILQQSPQQ
jgi:hypothetical protein